MEPSYVAKSELVLPALSLREMVVFPYMWAPFVVGRESSVRALELALASPSKRLFLNTQRDREIDAPTRSDIHEMGVVARVIQNLKLPNGNIRVMVEGEQRARLRELTEEDGAVFADVETFTVNYPVDANLQTYMSKVLDIFEQYAKMSNHLEVENPLPTIELDDPDHFADTLAAHLIGITTAEKQSLLETLNPYVRLQRLHDMLDVEIEKINIDKRINDQVKKQMERAQREYYLNEKVKVMEEVLARGDWAGVANEKQKEYLKLKINTMKKELSSQDDRADDDKDLEEEIEGEPETPDMEKSIEEEVKKRMERAQKEYYLNEKIRAIREELGLRADLADVVKEPSILRSIEFPPEYHEAGVSILSYFATVLRQKYAGTEVAVIITQEGHKVTMAIETPEGKREEIERALNDFGLVVRGEMGVNEFLDDPIQILDLKNEIRIMHARLESKDQLMATKDQLIWHQEVTIDRLGQLLSQALEPQPVSQLPPIHIHHNSPLHVVVDAKGGDATIQHAFCLEQQLPVLHAHLQEAANALPAEEGRQLLEAGAALGQLAEGADESQVKAVLARTAQAFQDLGDDKSKLSKALKGAKKAGKALQAAGRTYNSIARWCGAPVVPEVLLGKGE